jgi:hypothetical protein
MARASWTFILTDANGSALAELNTASGRTIALKRNSYTEVNLTISHEDDAAALLLNALASTGVPKLKGYRRSANADPSAPATLMFRGYLAALSEQSDETSLLTATFRSPFGVLVGDGDKAGRFVQGQFDLVYTATDAGMVAQYLINIANADSPTGLATDPSLIVATKLRDRDYPVGQNIGSAVTDLTAVLDGFDFYETFVDTGMSPTRTSLPAPGGPTGLFGSLANAPWGTTPGTYYWVVTAVVSGVETTPSNEVSFLVSSSHTVEIAWTAVPGASAYNIYRSSVSGGESVSPALVTSIGPSVPRYNDTGSAVSAGATGTVPFSPLWYPDAYFNVTDSLGVVNPGARFEYGPSTLSNVGSVSRTTTPPQNCVFITGGNGLTSTYMDTDSVAKYGKWWGHSDFSAIIDQGTLDDKARGLCRPNPVKTVSFIPDLALSPLPFDDWNLGDTVPFLAARGALMESTQLRVNGFSIPIDESGFETVSVDDPTQPSEDAVMKASLIAEVVVADGGSIPA